MSSSHHGTEESEVIRQLKDRIAARLQQPVITARGRNYEVVYTWPDGTEEVRYRRPISDLSCANEVLGLRRNARMNGYESPYSVRRVP